jgi:glutamate---cysteine ligase / carboxylate-amine ligase
MDPALTETRAWAEWKPGGAYTVGAEEELMLLNPHDWSLAQQVERVLPALGPELEGHVTAETQRSMVELNSSPHQRVAELATELGGLRAKLELELSGLGLRAASAGTHPFTVWHETVVTGEPRYQMVYGSMRELARREPTMALHVHVGVEDPEDAIQAVNRTRGHLPMLLAVSVNSPYWQGRDTGLASARTPLFQAFPRVGIPRRFDDYADWVETVDLLVSCEAFPEPTFLWWDVRPQPRFGTIEVRICDAQSELWETAAICALIQCITRLEVTEGYLSDELVSAQEVLDENRFLAARDGMRAELIDPNAKRRVPAREALADVLDACAPHARALGCAKELDDVGALAERTGSDRQLERARGSGRLRGLVATLADHFSEGPGPVSPDGAPGSRIGPTNTREESIEMAKDHGPTIKDDELYETLRDEGESKEKAARIANAKAGGEDVSEKGGEAPDYEDRTKEELEERAAEIGIEGRSEMSKDELIDALRNH